MLAVLLILTCTFAYGLSDGLVLINGGTFMMGSPAEEPLRVGNEIQREVTIGSFYIGMYEVTQDEYQEIMNSNPSYFKGPDLPVEQVSWFSAIAYCNALSEKMGLEMAYTINGQTVSWNRNANGYRLPTEAEWEYSCRAGTMTPFNTGDNVTIDQANYDGRRPYNKNAAGDYRQKTTAVGSFPPNSFGLFDMHGNVGEWCWDWNAEYARGAQLDPAGADIGSYRVFRGGSWNHAADFLRSARRGGNLPSTRGYYLGFRIARNAE